MILFFHNIARLTINEGAMRKIGYVFIVLAMLSCQKENPFQEGRFENVFQTLPVGKGLCLLISNRECHACDLFYRTLNKHPELAEQFAKDYVCYDFPADIVGNEFLTQLLYEYSFPVLLFFNNEKELRGVWAGARPADELSRLMEVLQFSPRFQTNMDNRLGMENEPYRKMVSTAVQAYLACQQKNWDVAEQEVKQSLENGAYFYNLYLAALVKEAQGDSLQAKEFARKALAHNNKLDSLLYSSLYGEMLYITGDKTALATQGGKMELVFDRTTYNCGEIKQHAPCEFKFEYKNLGKEPIIIVEVSKSCNCMDVTWEKRPILPNESGYITVKYDTSQEGFFSKVLFVCLNGKRAPVPLFIKGMVSAL